MVQLFFVLCHPAHSKIWKGESLVHYKSLVGAFHFAEIFLFVEIHTLYCLYQQIGLEFLEPHYAPLIKGSVEIPNTPMLKI